MSQMPKRFRSAVFLGHVEANIPRARSNVSYSEVFVILNWYVWMDVVANNVLPEIVLKVQPSNVSVRRTQQHVKYLAAP